ncbi:MAG: class I adenylate-forming enzyme family protein [Akkermansia sp.]
MRHAENMPGKTAVVLNGQDISYGELLSGIRRAATRLRELGLAAGGRIMLAAHKEASYLYLYFGAQLLGITTVLTDPDASPEYLHALEQRIRPAYGIGYRSAQFPSIDLQTVELDTADEYTELPAGLRSSDIAEILFTTGTTGNAKGVCLSHDNIFASASHINGYIGNSADDTELLALPLCHSFGMGRIRCSLLRGATVVILKSFANVRAFLRAIEEHAITGFSVVPAAWAYIRKISGTRIANYAGQIRWIEIGSASMPRAVKEEMAALFPDTALCMHYGLTEASRSCFTELHDTAHLDSIGKPTAPTIDVKICAPNGCEVPVGEKGEICIRGKMVAARYLDEEDNSNAFWGDYLRTGDCGCRDREGYLYLLGREKELINVGGKKVSPAEVEEAVMSLGVGDCLCVPTKDESGIMGELVFCYILRGSTTLSFEEIAAQLAKRLELHKCPVAYDWIDAIPTTASGKKQRLALRR